MKVGYGAGWLSALSQTGIVGCLFDCHRSRVPVLAIAAQIPSAEMDRDAALANRLADCNLEGARHFLHAGDEFTVVTAFLEQRFRVRFLEIP